MRAFNTFTSKTALLLIIFGLVANTAARSQEFHFDSGRQKDAISFRLMRNLVIIPVYINGKGPYNFILDTGIGPMILTDSTVIEGMDLKKLRPIKISGLGNGPEIEALLSNEISARVGRASLDYIPTAILKEDLLGLSNYVGINISGLLGYYFFRSFLVNINYSSNRMVFFLPGEKRRIKGERIPMEVVNNKPYINILLEDPAFGRLAVRMVVDNGAGHALSMETLNHRPFPVPAGAITANLGIGLGGPIGGSMGRIQNLRLGSFSFRNVITSYPIYDDLTLNKFLRERNGNLGADVLSRFNVTFDYEGGDLYLARNATFKKPFEHDMSGIELYTDGNDPKRLFVNRIEPGSAAEEADMQVGDEILSVNFSKIGLLNLDELTKVLRAGDGRTVFFTLNRSGRLLVKLIKLKKRI